MQVRRKADSARDPVREFITKWRDASSVQRSPVFKETSSALEELGQYYMKRGQRVALDKSTVNSVLGKLERAEAGLPPEEEKKGMLRGLFSGKS